jgi:hypothetical protein
MIGGGVPGGISSPTGTSESSRSSTTAMGPPVRPAPADQVGVNEHRSIECRDHPRQLSLSSSSDDQEWNRRYRRSEDDHQKYRCHAVERPTIDMLPMYWGSLAMIRSEGR